MSPEQLTLEKKLEEADKLGQKAADYGRQLDEAYLEGVRNSKSDISEKVKADGWAAVPKAIKDGFYETRKLLEGVKAQVEISATEAHSRVVKEHDRFEALRSGGWDNPSGTSTTDPGTSL